MMAETLYASFTDPSMAEKATGALLDYGVRADDISLVRKDAAADRGRRDVVAHSATLEERRVADEPANRAAAAGDRAAADASSAVGGQRAAAGYEAAADERAARADYDAGTGRSDTAWRAGSDRRDDTDAGDDLDLGAKRGISTTTPADAGVGAAKGAGIGLGLGILGALAALAIPGVGLVLGGGALATAIGAAAATTAAGAVTGGVYGYLKEQGMPEQAARAYHEAYEGGAAILAIQAPSGDVDRATIEQVLAKYGAANVSTWGAAA